MTDKRTLESEFDNLDGQRSQVLERGRQCAEQTHPSVLPRAGLTENSDLQGPYQGLGAYGATNLTNKLLLTMFPVGVPWFQNRPSAKIRSDPLTTPESLAKLEAQLYFRDLLVRDQLEAARLRTRSRTAIEQVVVVGNTLPMMQDDYTIKVFRLDQYVQKRAGSSLWLDLITHETVDPRELTEEQLAKAEVSQTDLKDRDFTVNPLHLYTKCSRQREGGFVIRQELNDKIIQESEEPVSRYFPTGYVEIPGEHYSRGFIEEKLGPLRSLNGLTIAILDAAAAMSKVLFVLDDSGEIRAIDLTKPSGSVIIGRVVGGIVDKVGVIQADKSKDMTVARLTAMDITEQLSRQMLIESAVQPEGERVTAYQVNRIARELEGATGGIFAQINEELQGPLVKYTTWKMKKENKLPMLEKPIEDEVNVEILTGLEALGRQRDAEKIQSLIPLLQAMPELGRYIRQEWILATAVRGLSIDEKAAVKSKEEVAAEDAQAAEMQLKQQLAMQAMQTGGKIAENASKGQAQGQ